MAVRKRRITLSKDWRERIKVGEIMNRLNRHVYGKVEMSTTQIAAAKLLLSKVAPDLRAIEISGSLEYRSAEELTDNELADIATAGRKRTDSEKKRTQQPTRVH